MAASTRAQLGLPVMGNPIGRVDEYVKHTEAGAEMPSTASVAQEIARVNAIHAFHRSLGWQGFGYSVITFKSGRVYEGRGGGRSGSHTQTRNSRALASCSAGHGDRQPMSEAEIAGDRAVMGQFIAEGYLTPNPKITGHRNYANKSCPGNLVYPQLGRLRGVTGPNNARPAPTPAPAPKPKDWFTMATREDLRAVVAAELAKQTPSLQAACARDDRDNKVWAVGPAGRFHIANADAYALLQLAGAIENKPLNQVQRIDGATFLDGIPVCATPMRGS